MPASAGSPTSPKMVAKRLGQALLGILGYMGVLHWLVPDCVGAFRPSLAALIATSPVLGASSDVTSVVAGYVGLALVSPALAALAGVATARVMRHLGGQRLRIVAVACVLHALLCYAAGQQALRVGALATDANHRAVVELGALVRFQGLTSLCSLAPAVLGAWLGCKLWPWPATAAPPPLETGEGDA